MRCHSIIVNVLTELVSFKAAASEPGRGVVFIVAESSKTGSTPICGGLAEESDALWSCMRRRLHVDVIELTTAHPPMLAKLANYDKRNLQVLIASEVSVHVPVPCSSSPVVTLRRPFPSV